MSEATVQCFHSQPLRSSAFIEMVLPLLKICTTLALSLSTSVYAGHIGSSYGAPSYSSGGGNSISSSYGAPSFGGGGGGGGGGGHGGGAITSAYSIPSSAYGAPSGGYSGGGGGGGGGGYGGDHGGHEHYEHPKPYEFGYSVKDPHTGSDFKQQESSDGHTVRGQYKVHLPDGRIQIVTYTADWKTGFHADVKYEGEAVYPSTYGHGGGGGGHGGGSSTYGVPSTGFSHGGGGDYGGSSVGTATGTSYNNIGGGHGGGGYESSSGGGYGGSSGGGYGGSSGGGYPSAGFHQSSSSYSVPGY